jgi:hypothetical protein
MKRLPIVIICILAMILIGCDASNALMDEARLADEGWVQYQIDFLPIGDMDMIEFAYREGFHRGFCPYDLVSDIYFPTDQERMALDMGVADGTWNRIGDY